MRYLHRWIARLVAWCLRKPEVAVLDYPLVQSFGPTVYRDVTRHGVRVYSLCGGCGVRLECSATLCEECAQGPHTSAF